MARPDPHGRGHRPHAKTAGAQEQQDEELQESEKKESDLERAQNRVGNAAMAAMLGTSNAAGDGAGGSGVAHALSNAAREQQGPALGGEDDPVDDGPITLEELTRSWNPRLKRDKDRPEFRESMPDDDLPPADAAWLRVVREAGPLSLPPTSTVDGLLQPSEETVVRGLTPWVREAGRWLGDDPALRALAFALAPPAPCLQDPWGRVLLARARAGAAATWLLLDGPALSGSNGAERPSGAAPEAASSALVQLCLELAGSGRLVDQVQRWAEEHGGKLPTAEQVLVVHLPDGDAPERWRTAPARPVPPATREPLAEVLRRLADLPSAATLLPSLPRPQAGTPDDDDDPLGLDAILAEHTGPGLDPQTSLYATCLGAAERLAGSAARLRVRFAGLAAAVARASRHWSTGSPSASLVEQARRLDREVARVLGLLVEVARAAQRRAVAVRGVQNGLRRAARSLDELADRTLADLAGVAAAVLPEAREVPAPPLREDDPLELALRDGHPADALPWLRTSEHTAAEVGVRMSCGEAPDALVAPLRREAERARSIGRPHLADTLETCLGACLLWSGRHDEALELARAHLALGRQRRNGMAVAAATLLGVEAHLAEGRDEDAVALRLEGGRLAWQMGARGALTLLARWRPADD